MGATYIADQTFSENSKATHNMTDITQYVGVTVVTFRGIKLFEAVPRGALTNLAIRRFLGCSVLV